LGCAARNTKERQFTEELKNMWQTEGKTRVKYEMGREETYPSIYFIPNVIVLTSHK